MYAWIARAMLGGTALVALGCSSAPATYVPTAAPADGPIATIAVSADPRLEISGTGTDATLDRLVVAFMLAHRVPNAELAVSKGRATTFTHAYTYRAIAPSTTTTQTLMRLASNTKAWTSAALYNLITAGKVNPQAKVFAYLGLTDPLPVGAHVDPRVYRITIRDMILHESGWDDSKAPYYDPSFEMRRTALALGLTHEIDQEQYVRYQLHQPLQEKPGTKFAYCNFCYDVLGMVIAKASGMPYADYVQKYVATPSGAGTFAISPTLDPRLPGEVAHYYDGRWGLSAIFVTSKQLYQFPYGVGGTDEVAQGDGGAATNAESLLALMNHYAIWGVAKPPHRGYGAAREGEMPGTESYAEQAPNGTNWGFIINSDRHTDPYFDQLQGAIERHLNGKCFIAC